MIFEVCFHLQVIWDQVYAFSMPCLPCSLLPQHCPYWHNYTPCSSALALCPSTPQATKCLVRTVVISWPTKWSSFSLYFLALLSPRILLPIWYAIEHPHLLILMCMLVKFLQQTRIWTVDIIGCWEFGTMSRNVSWILMGKLCWSRGGNEVKWCKRVWAG